MHLNNELNECNFKELEWNFIYFAFSLKNCGQVTVRGF
jgi:hypothetical protein